MTKTPVRVTVTGAAVFDGVFVGPGVEAGVAFVGGGPEVPLHFAGFRIARFGEVGDVEEVAAHAGDDVVLDHQRSHRAEIVLVQVADRLVPALFSIFQIERNIFRCLFPFGKCYSIFNSSKIFAGINFGLYACCQSLDGQGCIRLIIFVGADHSGAQRIGFISFFCNVGIQYVR